MITAPATIAERVTYPMSTMSAAPAEVARSLPSGVAMPLSIGPLDQGQE